MPPCESFSSFRSSRLYSSFSNRRPYRTMGDMRPLDVAAFGLTLALQAGCTTSRVEVVRDMTSTLQPDGRIVVLARRDNIGPEPEKSFLKCLTGKLRSRDNRLQAYPEQEFLDALFPWFEPRLAPKKATDLKPILGRTAAVTRLRNTGVRYLVWVEGHTETTDGGGAISCAAGPTGGGCFGFVWWDKDSSYEVTVWDLERAESVGSVSAEAVGTSYLPAVVVPVPLIAMTQSAACEGLSKQLKQLLIPETNAR